MKKLIALILILVMALSSCDILLSTPDNGQGNNGTNNGGGILDSILGGSKDDGDNDVGFHGDCTDGHVDGDNNGLCDACKVSVLVWFDFYSVNDLHGKIVNSDSQPGIEELTTYLKTAKENNPNTILLSSGDIWQGSSESNLTHGALLTDWMEELGFAAMTLGNHEFDWGGDDICANAEAADFPFLAINIYDKTTQKQMDYCESSITVEMGGMQIGIIGAIGDCYSSISKEVVGNVEFKTGKALTELVKAESEKLRAEGVDFIIYSIHDGYGSSSSSKKTVKDSDISNYYDIALSGGYVDLVFEAHTHQSYVLYDSKGVYHLQGGGENKGISHAKVSINSANGKTTVSKAEVIKSSTYSTYQEDPLIDELLKKYEDMINAAYEVLGVNAKYRDDSELEAFVAKLYYEYGVEKWGDEYDIFLGGGFLRTRNPYNLKAGEITYSDLYSLLPFDNEIVLCAVTGRQLLNNLINSSSDDYYIYLDGHSTSGIDYNKTYYIVTDTYTSTYTYNNFTEVERYTPGVYARDLVADFFKKNNGWR